jgi:putative oxidoreductase
MNNGSNSIAPLFGRLLMSSVFLFSGVTKVAAFHMITGFAQAKGLPFPALAIGGAAAVEILGGLAVLTGFQARLTAWILFVYLIPTTLIFHNFWALDGAARQDAQIHFLKNLAIMGGLLILASFGAGAYSADNRAAAKV